MIPFKVPARAKLAQALTLFLQFWPPLDFDRHISSGYHYLMEMFLLPKYNPSVHSSTQIFERWRLSYTRWCTRYSCPLSSGKIESSLGSDGYLHDEKGWLLRAWYLLAWLCNEITSFHIYLGFTCTRAWLSGASERPRTIWWREISGPSCNFILWLDPFLGTLCGHVHRTYDNFIPYKTKIFFL